MKGLISFIFICLLAKAQETREFLLQVEDVKSEAGFFEVEDSTSELDSLSLVERSHPEYFLQLGVTEDPTYEELNSEDIQLDSQYYAERSSLDADSLYQDDSADKTNNYDGNLWEV